MSEQFVHCWEVVHSSECPLSEVPLQNFIFSQSGEDELSGSEGSEMAAELEEKEAIALQQRLTAAISEADFMAPSLPVRNSNPSSSL